MKEFIILVMETMKCIIDGKEQTHQVEREWKMCLYEGNVHYMSQGGVGSKLGKASPSLIKSLK